MEVELESKKKKLYNKIRKYQKKWIDVEKIVEDLGYEYSCIFPVNFDKVSADGAQPEIIQLRINHHENKRLKVLKEILKIINEKEKEKNQIPKPITEPFKIESSVVSIESIKDKLEIKQKRREAASERALQLRINQKVELLKKLKEKEIKSKEHKNKYLAEVKEKIEKFKREEKNKYELAKQNSIVLYN